MNNSQIIDKKFTFKVSSRVKGDFLYIIEIMQ